MTEEERKQLELAAQTHMVFTEFIERALQRSQQLCGEIESGDLNAIETAKEVVQKLSNLWEAWNLLAGNKLKPDSDA